MIDWNSWGGLMSKVKLAISKTDIGYFVDINNNIIAGSYSPFNHIVKEYTTDTKTIIDSISYYGIQKEVCIEEKDWIENGEFYGTYEVAFCPHCNKEIYDSEDFHHLRNNAKFCPYCGESIRWNKEVNKNENT